MTITDDIRAIATAFLVIGLVLEGYLLWKRKNGRAVNDSSQPTRDKQGGRWATLGIHFFSFVSVSFFIYFEVTESMRGEFEGITFEGGTCLSEEVDPISGYSRKEVCELSVQFFDALNSQDVNIITAYLFPFVAENIVITINPRGSIPEFMVPTCTVGEDEAKEKIYEAFEIMGATIEYAEVNATTTSDISVYMRTFLLGHVAIVVLLSVVAVDPTLNLTSRIDPALWGAHERHHPTERVHNHQHYYSHTQPLSPVTNYTIYCASTKITLCIIIIVYITLQPL